MGDILQVQNDSRSLSAMASSSLPSFMYDDIPKGNYFRYLILHPGRKEDPLTCSLRSSHIHDAPHYEAISYVWGSNKLDQPIICNDSMLLITQNLSMALRRSRLQHAPRVLWADSICINQQSIEEKGHQVAVMGQIYRDALRVLVCIGEDPEGHAHSAHSLVEEVFGMISDERNKIDTAIWDSFPHLELIPFVKDVRWGSLEMLLRREWFVRGWVLREAALAQQACVIWGACEVGWHKIMTVMWWLSRRAGGTMLSGDVQLIVQVHADAYFARHKSALRCFGVDDDRGTDLLYYLTQGRGLHMTDQRDRLYAFLDMPMDQDSQVKIVPDYNKTALEIFYEFAAGYINTTKDSNILEYVFHTSESLQSNVPTWMPDWSYIDVHYVLERRAKRLLPRTPCVVQPTLLNDQNLKVHGVLLGSVIDLTLVFDANGPTADILTSIWATIQSWTLHSVPCSMRTLLSVLTSAYDVYSDERLSTQREAKYIQALEDVCRPGLCDTRTELDNCARDVHELVKDRANGKRVILTKRGTMGLCPGITQEGDICAIVFGCTAPCVLRRTSQENHFKFVGSCFLLGSRPSQRVTGEIGHWAMLGTEYSKDWVDWGIEEQDIYLC